MRNLKKMLSLVMALAMIASFMVVGASAAKFSDDKDIKNVDAVNTLVALGVIKGYDTGDFKPAGTVTRAELAKMICVVMNGGRDPQLSAAVTNFKDVPTTHWAAGYIAYCVNTGYVSGYEDSTFKPDATVTGTQAAKMLLTAMGFKADAEGYVGANWTINVEVHANQYGLYDNLGTMNPSAGLTRDNAAQMIYNAVQGNMVEYTYNPITQNGQLTLQPVRQDKIYDIGGTNYNDNILHNKFDMVTAYGYMTAHSYDGVKDKYTYTFTNAASFGGAVITTAEGGITAGTTLTTATDYTDMYGMKVKVMYKNDTNKTVFGVYAKESSVVASGVTGDIGTIDATAKTVKVDGTAHKVSSTGIAVYNKNVGVAAGETLATLKDEEKAFSFTLIDNNGDSKADAVIKTPMKIAKISYVSSDSITVGSPVSNTFQIDDINIYEGFAKSDWVYFTSSAYSATGDDTFVKAELKTGTVEGTKSSTDYKIDGVWFTKSTDEHNNNAIALTDTIEYVALGGMVYYTKVTESGTTTKDIAMVITSAQKAAIGVDGAVEQARIILTDGTKKTITVAQVDGVPATTANVATLIGKMTTYKVNSDGEYEFTTVSASNLAGYKGYGTTLGGITAYNNKQVGGYELSDDAVVFALKGVVGIAAATNDGKVYTGRELKNAYGAGTFGTAGVGISLYGTTNGFNYAKVGVVVHSALPTINSGSSYGYLTSGAYNSYEGGKTYINYTFWTAEGQTVDAREESTNALTPYAAGAIITYDTVDATTIKNVAPVIATTSVVTGWDDNSKIQITGLGGSKIDSVDTVVIYVDSANKKGANGSIVIGEDTNGDDVADQANVRYVGNTTTINLLVVDVKNKMAAGAPVVLGVGATAAQIATALGSSSNVIIDGNYTIPAVITVPTGRTLTINGVMTASAANAVTGAGTLAVNTFADGPSAALAQTSTVVVKLTDAIASLEAIPVPAGKTLILGAASTGNVTANKWFTAAGNSTTAGTAVANTVTAAVGTYVATTCYTDAAGTNAVAWLLQ